MEIFKLMFLLTLPRKADKRNHSEVSFLCTNKTLKVNAEFGF